VETVPGTIVRAIQSVEEVLIGRAVPAGPTAATGYARAIIEPWAVLISEQGATIRDQAETIGRLKAELEAISAEAVRAKIRESQLLAELEQHRAEARSHSAALVDTPVPIGATTPWRQRWTRGVIIAAFVAAIIVIVMLLLFVLPPLDLSL
jgi:hypothetical protein